MKNRNKRGVLYSFKLLILGLFGMGKAERSALEEEAVASPSITALKNFFSNPIGIIGFVGFLAIVAFVGIGQKTTEFDPYYSQGILRNIGPGFGYLDFPKEISDKGIKDISSGISYSVGLTEDGNIYFWGKDNEGATKIPPKYKEIIDKEKVEFIASGDKHVIAYTKEGNFLGWGNNEFNQIDLPKEVKTNIKKSGIKKLGAGDQYSIVLTNDNNLYVWGSTKNNKLDRVPKKAKGRVIDFTNSPSNIIVLLDDNSIDYFGGKGSSVIDKFPKDYKDGKKKVKSVAMTIYSGTLIDGDGKLFSWGSDLEGTLKPPMIDEKIVELKSGRSHYVALTETGNIYSWGTDNYGEVNDIPDGKFNKIFAEFFQNYAVDEDGQLKAWGNKGFILGTDEGGRNLFIRIIHGGRITLIIAAVATIISLLIGVIVGMISGFYGGIVDNLLMRFAEIVASFPFLPLVITLSAILPPETSQSNRLLMIMVILGVLGWTGIARLVRGQILAEREKDYILASRALGLKESKIIISHILPNIVSIIIVQATIGYASALLTEAGLSFLGFGVKPPFPSWGNMMTAAQKSEVIRKFWWRWIFPALAVFFTALTVNLIGDGIRDAIDPKANER